MSDLFRPLPTLAFIPSFRSTRQLLGTDTVDMTPPEPPPKFPHPLIPACRACRAKKRTCVSTAAAGRRNRRCDHCRLRHAKCVFEETEAEQAPGSSVGKKRQRTVLDDLDDPKGKQPRRQSSEEIEALVGEEDVQLLHVRANAKRDTGNAVRNDSGSNVIGGTDTDRLSRSEAALINAEAEEATERTVLNESKGDVLEVADTDRLARLETMMQKFATDASALMQAVTRTMTALAEEQRERAESNRKAFETINLMSKVIHKMVDAGLSPSTST
ncbi:hypothetical protein EDC04DRAFT_2905308 [Pisolithus marmoratus]|nr:hypothetical protein EDC04DRAFT_2905308 [Pisolithus marmoratus]